MPSANSSDVTSRLRRVSSPQNAVVKSLRRAFAHAELTEDGYCAIESLRVIEEAVRSSLKFKIVFFSESGVAKAERVLQQMASSVDALVLPDEVFKGAVGTETPQGIAALVKLKTWKLEELVRQADAMFVMCCGIQDPGNVGTILRSAEAFAAAGVLLTEGTVSPYNPKVVRASAGSLFRMPLITAKTDALLPALREAGVRLLATSSHGGAAVHQAKLTGKIAMMIGNEGAGIPKALLAQADETVFIPHSGRVESLN